MMSSRRLVSLAILCLLVVGAAAWWGWARFAPPPPVLWQGYADADFVRIGPTQPGQLTAVSVTRGDEVAAGAPLFAQDDTAEKAALAQAQQQYAQARDQLANLEAGAKPTEIRQAVANLADAQATWQRAQADLQRGETLLRTNVASRQSVDQLRAAEASAQAKVQALQAALAQAQAPLGRQNEIAAQRAAMEAAQAAVAQAAWRLAQRSVAAPMAGRIADVMARPGETLAAGVPVVSLLSPANILVRFFVPETAIAGIHRGDEVTLACDGCPADLAATISFVAPQAEYTPPVIYSEASRAKLAYLVEAHPKPGQATLLHPGQPVQVRRAALP